MSTTQTPSPNSDFGLPRTEFKPLNQGNNGLKVALIVLSLLIMAGAGTAYWFLYSSSSDELLKEVDVMLSPEIEDNEIVALDEPLAIDDKDNTLVKEENSFIPPQEGTLTKITRPQGKYYVVTNCFIDADLATDYANKLVAQGEHVVLLTPPQGQYFFCVAVAENNTLYSANQKMQNLKSLYGSDIWVKKY